MWPFNKKEIQQENRVKFSIGQPKITALPDLVDKTTIDVRYELIPPFVSVHIFWDRANNELVYNVEEPILDLKERTVLHIVEEGIKELINISFIGIKDVDTIIEYLEKNIKVLLDELRIKISDESFVKIMYYVYRDFVGLNEIEPLMRDFFIEDIQCNGVNTPIYLVHRKYRNLRTNIIFTDFHKLTSFVEKLAQKCGQYISYANPLLDAQLPDGSRINATFTTDITTRGPTITIRKFTKVPWTPTQLIQMGTTSAEILAYMWMVIESQGNLLVVGGTGSGKTSLLNSIAFFIPYAARVVSIEDTRELQLLHENWLPSVARAGVGATNLVGQKQGEVSLFDLLKESFRQRPDYVIVGEIRGQEAYVLFQGAASGHSTMSTMHAENVDTVVRRLETPPINLSPALVEILDVVLVMAQAKLGDIYVRRVREVSEVLKVGHDRANTNQVFAWDPMKDTFYFKGSQRVFDKISKLRGWTKDQIDQEFRLRTRLLQEMTRKGIFDFKHVQDVITAYYKTPKGVLRYFGIM